MVASARAINKITEVPSDIKLELDVAEEKSIDDAVRKVIETMEG